MNPAEIPSLAKAVNRWLSYQLLCGREPLLSEAYLGHPIAEYLIHKHSGEFATEVDHPVLKKPGPGRPRQIDYALLTKNKGVIESAIECKWISGYAYDKQRIVNDILRLECVRIPKRNVRRYFIVAGLERDFELNFKSLRINAGASRTIFTTEFLSFSMKNPKKKIQVRNCADELEGFYRDFELSFKAAVPLSFYTKLINYRRADNIFVYIWEVSSSKNRGTHSFLT